MKNLLNEITKMEQERIEERINLLLDLKSKCIDGVVTHEGITVTEDWIDSEITNLKDEL